MKKIHLLAAGAMSLAMLGGGAVAWAASGNQNPAQPAAPAQTKLIAAAPIDTTTESKFTPVAPCRVADTRVAGGAMHSNATRDFYVGGTTAFVFQGGKSGGCAIPTTATAVALTITSVSPNAKGYLRIWRSGDAEPQATFMNYGTSFNTAASGTTGISSLGKARVHNYGATSHLVIDVTGYYLAPMYAEVSSTGTLVRGSRVTATSLISGSSYQVTFDRDVTNCAYAASSYFGNYTLTVEPRSLVANAVYVETLFNDAASTDQFYLTVTC